MWWQRLGGVSSRQLFGVAAVSVGIIEAATKLTSQGDYGIGHKRHENLKVACTQSFTDLVPCDEVAGRVLARLVEHKAKKPADAGSSGGLKTAGQRN
jgi:hypothetical protein